MSASCRSSFPFVRAAKVCSHTTERLLARNENRLWKCTKRGWHGLVYGRMNYSNGTRKLNNPFTIPLLTAEKFISLVPITCSPLVDNLLLLALHLQFLTLLAIIGTSCARKIIIKSNPDKNADLFQDKDFTFSQDKEDTQDPSTFRGDPMKTKTVISENVQGKKSFKFA
jgi:hypothetical protein